MISDPKRENDSTDDVGRLIRIAGQPQMPAERLRRAKVAAHATWERQARRRRRAVFAGRIAILAAAASVALLLAVAVMRGPGSAPPGPAGSMKVELVAGKAQIGSAAGRSVSNLRELEPVDVLTSGSVVLTSGDDRAALRLPSGHSLRLDHGSRIRMLDPTSLALDRGAVYLDSGAGGARGRKIAVETWLGRLEEIGTQYEIRLASASVRIRVREGAVVLHHANENHEVSVGTEMEILPDGSTSTREIATSGEEWTWISDVTPSMELGGRTARAFLDWAARERGLRLVFSGEETERAASEVQVAGDIHGMTIEQALDAVLPSCRMAYRVQSGLLIVSPEPDPDPAGR